MKSAIHFLWLLFSSVAFAAPEPFLHVLIPTRDGVDLCANIWLPASRGRVPVALYRTPYKKTDNLNQSLQQFRDAGFAVMVQDVRGRGHSTGVFRQIMQEENDAEDTLNWIVRQNWSDGSVGLFGGSYPGIAAWRGALSGHPAVKGVAVSFAGGDEYLDRYYSPGGAFKLGHRLWWLAENLNVPMRKRPPFPQLVQHAPLRTGDVAATGQVLDFFRAAIDHPSYAPYWKALSTLQRVPELRTPAHITGGWFDNYCASDIEMFNALRAAGRPAQLILGPWGHNPSVPLEYVQAQAAASISIRGQEVAWLSDCVRKSASMPPSGIRYYVMGKDQWRDAEQWPPPESKPEEWYLSSRGNANSAAGDGVLENNPPQTAKPDRYVYDPRNPVPTLGGSPCCNPRMMLWGPLDQRSVESRPDVLVYTSGTLSETLEIAGSIKTVLWASSSAPDTDFTAKVVDVAPDGTARLVSNGILRLRYRHGLGQPAAYTPGSVERISVPAGVIAWQFAAGHRLRLEVSSSNFPLYDRNPNTGRPVGIETQFRLANQTILHDRQHPSRLVLPVRRSTRVASARNGSLR